jgi:hypothetical protein
MSLRTETGTVLRPASQSRHRPSIGEYFCSPPILAVRTERIFPEPLPRGRTRTKPLPSSAILSQVSFRKPFRAVPIKLGEHYQRKQRVREQQSALHLWGTAAAVGAAMGIASLEIFNDVHLQETQAIEVLSMKPAIVRTRKPHAGDYWSRCAQAKAADTYPIYMGEPGYRDELDGDSDGIACEAHQRP